MKYLPIGKRVRLIALALPLALLAIAALSIWHTTATQNNQSEESKKIVDAALREGVGSEVFFAKKGDGSANIRASVELVTQFMRKRAGVDLRGQTKNRLADMEAATLAGASRRITLDELSEIIAITALERISAASDEEIKRAAESLRGFDAPDLPDYFRKGRTRVRLRANRYGVDPTPDEFVTQVKAIRESSPIIKSALLKPAATNASAALVKSRTKYLSDSVPEEFGSAATDGLTPLQAILIVYSVVSDDGLSFSDSNLRKRMEAVQEIGAKQSGQPYPEPKSYLAYGPNGYIYSTPLDIVFNEQTVNLLLDHIAERSGSQ